VGPERPASLERAVLNFSIDGGVVRGVGGPGTVGSFRHDSEGDTVGVPKTFTMLAMAALSLASVCLLEGTAAAKTPTGSGMITCSVGGTLSWSQPLAPHSVPRGTSITTIDLVSTGSCGGGSSSPSAITIKPIKASFPKKTPEQVCAGGPLFGPVVKGQVTWNNVKPSKLIVNDVKESVNDGELELTAHPVVKGSFSGTGTMVINITQADTMAAGACTPGLTTVNIDPTTSAVTL